MPADASSAAATARIGTVEHRAAAVASIPAIMDAVVVRALGGPDVFRVEQVPVPEPGIGEVLVRIAATAVTPLDALIAAGGMQQLPEFAVAPPYTPGREAAGVVVAHGPAGRPARAGTAGEGAAHGPPVPPIGARVYVTGARTGTYAAYAACPVERVRPLPDRVGFAAGAAVGASYATAYVALFLRGGAAPAETVLVRGATGGVGLAAVQLARAAGLTVLGTGGTEAGRTTARREGAHHVLPHDAPDFAARVRAITGGRGVDVVLEMRAERNLVGDLDVLADGGRVVLVGGQPGAVTFAPLRLVAHSQDVRGLNLAAVRPDEWVRLNAAVEAGLENGTLRPLVRGERPLGAVAAAIHELGDAGPGGRMILVPSVVPSLEAAPDPAAMA